MTAKIIDDLTQSEWEELTDEERVRIHGDNTILPGYDEEGDIDYEEDLLE